MIVSQIAPEVETHLVEDFLAWFTNSGISEQINDAWYSHRIQPCGIVNSNKPLNQGRRFIVSLLHSASSFFTPFPRKLSLITLCKILYIVPTLKIFNSL